MIIEKYECVCMPVLIFVISFFYMGLDFASFSGCDRNIPCLVTGYVPTSID